MYVRYISLKNGFYEVRRRVDKNKRSLAKAVTWRMVATSITMVLFYIATGKITISIMAGVAETVLKLGVYYAHERTWNKVKWGQER